MTRNVRRGVARLALLPVVAAAAPLATFMLPATPAAATTEAPSPTLPLASAKFSSESGIIDAAVSSAGRINVLSGDRSITSISGTATTAIDVEADVVALASGPDGLLYGLSEASRGYQLVKIADDGTPTVVGDLLGDDMHMMMHHGYPSLDFDPNGTPTVTFPFGSFDGDASTSFIRMVEDGRWVSAGFRSEGAIVGSVPQADGSILYRHDVSGDLYRFTPGQGAELIGDLPDGYFFHHRAPNDLAGTADGTVYFMDGLDVQRRQLGGEITTVGVLDTELLPLDFEEGGRAIVLFASETQVYVSFMNDLYQLDLDTTAPVITVTGLTNGATLKQGDSRQVTVKCDDVSSVTACSLRLDGKSVESVSLASLGRGRHRLVVDAIDALGNTASKTVEFGVAGKREITGDLAASNGTSGTVARLYMAVFSRQPDGAGQGYWVDQHHAGASLQKIAEMFVTSPEFRETYDALDNDEFLAVLYRNVMDRDPDAEGLAYWKQLIDSDLSRAEITLWFSESAEFQQLTFTL